MYNVQMSLCCVNDIDKYKSPVELIYGRFYFCGGALGLIGEGFIAWLLRVYRSFVSYFPWDRRRTMCEDDRGL